MENPRVSIIAAIGKNRELGKKGELIWRISDDLKRAKALTMGHPLIMGRKTHESIGKPLPGRTNIVVSSTIKEIPGCVVAPSFEDALEKAKEIDKEEIFIFGGAQIYAKAIGTTDRLYLTLINAEDSEADTFFPEYEKEFTKIIEKEERDQDGLAYSWVTLER